MLHLFQKVLYTIGKISTDAHWLFTRLIYEFEIQRKRSVEILEIILFFIFQSFFPTKHNIISHCSGFHIGIRHIETDQCEFNLPDMSLSLLMIGSMCCVIDMSRHIKCTRIKRPCILNRKSDSPSHYKYGKINK